MDFKSMVEEALMAGGVGSVFGPNVVNTASQFSGDTYAKGDARIPKSIYGGVLTRSGLKSKKKRKKKK